MMQMPSRLPTQRFDQPIFRAILKDRWPWRALIISTSFGAAALSLVAAGFQKFFIDSLSGDFAAGEKQQVYFLLNPKA